MDGERSGRSPCYGALLPAPEAGRAQRGVGSVWPRVVAVAVLSCAALAAGLAALAGQTEVSALLEYTYISRGRAARRQQLTDVLTAPIENVARALGDSLARQDGSTTSSLELTDVPTFGKVGSTSTCAATAADYKCVLEGDYFLQYMRSCCKTMYFPPCAQPLLPGLMSLQLAPAESPAEMGKPAGVRFRYFLGNGNDIVFNGGTADTIRFINRFFGYDIKTTPVKHRFHFKAATFVNGQPRIETKHNWVHLMPSELPNYDGITAVDVSSLPKGEATVIYDDAPPTGNGYVPGNRFSQGAASIATENSDVASPGFRLKYCEAADRLGNPKLNGGLPMKIHPADCPKILKEYGMTCKCGSIFFLGWVWPKAEENIYVESLMRMDKLAAGACSPAASMEPVPMPKIAPKPYQPPADPLRSCKEAPDYDPAAQNWYYDKKVTEGGSVRMVRHWCPSVWVPQEQWYKYQRYVPRIKKILFAKVLCIVTSHSECTMALTFEYIVFSICIVTLHCMNALRRWLLRICVILRICVSGFT